MTNKVGRSLENHTCQLVSQLTPHVHILLRIEPENVLTIFYRINRTQQEMKLVEEREKKKRLLLKLHRHKFKHRSDSCCLARNFLYEIYAEGNRNR
jgi:hypothetical protein